VEARWTRVALQRRATQFTSLGDTITADLLLPPDAGPSPLVVFVHGSESYSAREHASYPYVLAAAGFGVFGQRGAERAHGVEARGPAGGGKGCGDRSVSGDGSWRHGIRGVQRPCACANALRGRLLLGRDRCGERAARASIRTRSACYSRQISARRVPRGVCARRCPATTGAGSVIECWDDASECKTGRLPASRKRPHFAAPPCRFCVIAALICDSLSFLRSFAALRLRRPGRPASVWCAPAA
jgi:hypothetical protein